MRPVTLTATEIEDEMQDLLNKARCIARKRSGERTAESPAKVKRVQNISLIHFLPQQALQHVMLFKGKEFERFHFEIHEKIPDALYRCSPLGVDTRIWFGKKEDNFVSRLVWNTEPSDKAATMLAIICELIREKDAAISVSMHNQIIKNKC